MDEFQYVDPDVTYIYALVDPNTEKACYVGKATSPAQRYKRHLYDATQPGRVEAKHPKNQWIAGLAEEGKRPLLAILERVQGTWVTQWGPVEQRWIKKLSEEGHPLLNLQVLNGHRTQEDILEDALELGRELFDADI